MEYTLDVTTVYTITLKMSSAKHKLLNHMISSQNTS